MISLVVTVDSDTKNCNLAERDKAFCDVLDKFKEPYEIIYTTCSNYGLLNELRTLVSQQKQHHLVISAPSTNINTQIYTALDATDNGDVLLCTLDTNLELLEEILKKHFDGADLVYVRAKENWFKSIFTALGRGMYQMGLKVLGRGQDLCCDARVLYLNARSVNTIILNPALSKALRLANPDPEKKLRMVSAKKVYDNPTNEQKQVNKSFCILGACAFLYILVLLGMGLLFPLLNNGVYTGWVLLGLVVWLILGVLGSAIVGRNLYRSRLGYPIALNLQGEPVLNVLEYVSYNSELARQFAYDIDDEEILETEEAPIESEAQPIQNEEKIEPEVAESVSPAPTDEPKAEKTKPAPKKAKTTAKSKVSKNTKDKPTKSSTTKAKNKVSKPVISKISGKKSAKTKKN